MVKKTRLELTAKELRIIEFLALQKVAVLSKNAFLNHLYNVFTCKLRPKFIENSAERFCVDTVWRKGYILRAARDY